ncbi:MAG: hypothetical protein ACAI25_10075 [Planctomycetota bacterium]
MKRLVVRIFVLGLVLAAAGCVERKLVVKPDPADAHVFVDGVEIASVQSRAVYRYEHYGIHRVVVRKMGYEVDERLVTLDPPWYQIFPIDFFFDVLWPATIEDTRELEVPLVKRTDLEGQERPGRAVMERARAMEIEANKKP